MKSLLVILISTLVISACTKRKGAVISYEKKIVNLGSLSFKEPYHGKILIKNTGDQALKISQITPDCSCTVPKMDNNRILPGDSAYIKFTITASGDGFIQQSIYVNNNSVNESRVLFLLRGKIKPEKITE